MRLNCEGSEDDTIYAFYQSFGKDLIHVFGSLKDVKVIKGESSFNNLKKFLRHKRISFTNFSSSVETWHEAFTTLHFLLEKK